MPGRLSCPRAPSGRASALEILHSGSQGFVSGAFNAGIAGEGRGSAGEPAFSPAGAAGRGYGPAARSQVPSETRSRRRKRPQSQPSHSGGNLSRELRFPVVSADPSLPSDLSRLPSALWLHDLGWSPCPTFWSRFRPPRGPTGGLAFLSPHPSSSPMFK